MTDFHALDLSGDRAALHRWDGRGWTPVASAPMDDAPATMGRVLADLLAPVAGMVVAVAIPTDRITVADVPAAASQDVPGDLPADTRCDWITLPTGGWRRMSLPDAALAEVEAFLAALGVRPGGCMAAAGDDLPPAWFGTSDGPVEDGRATDRPRCLGPASPAPHSRIVAARLRAHAVAARDPAHLIPLPDPAPGADSPLRRARFGVPRLRARPLLAAVLLLAAVGTGLIGWHGTWDRGPTRGTPGVPDVAMLAAAPTADTAPVAYGPVVADDAPRRGATPMLDPDSADTRTDNAPRPSQQASLSAMDAPPGMIAAATFYSAPYLLSSVAAPDADSRLTIPGIDPVFRTDALALTEVRPPDPGPAARQTLNPPGPPAQTYVVDERGLIRPSAEGRVSPEGFTVIAGPPPAAVRPRPLPAPEDESIVLVMRRADLAADDPLRQLLPRLRPAGLAERQERTLLGGRTAGELAGFVPRQRPASAQEQAGPVVASVGGAAIGPRPAPRNPAVLARAQATAEATAGPAVAPADVARVLAPTSANVAESATTRVSINLSQVNLLGTFGAGNARRALVRLPSGRVVNLSVGDQVDGGRVQSIGDGRLGYVKSGRTVTLEMPRG